MLIQAYETQPDAEEKEEDAEEEEETLSEENGSLPWDVLHPSTPFLILFWGPCDKRLTHIWVCEAVRTVSGIKCKTHTHKVQRVRRRRDGMG